MPEELEERCRFLIENKKCMVNKKGLATEYPKSHTQCNFKQNYYPLCCSCSKHKEAKDRNVLTTFSIRFPHIYR